MKKPIKDLLEQNNKHQDLRKQVWIQAWCHTATAITCATSDTATKWADAALHDFDERFKK